MFAERAAKRERRPKRARVMVEEEKRPGGDAFAAHTDTPSKPEDQLSHFKNLYFALLDFEKVPSLASKCKKK